MWTGRHVRIGHVRDRLMPVAKKRGSSSAPWMCARNPD
jgi:hypothetical protein